MALFNHLFSNTLNIFLFLWVAFRLFDSKLKYEQILMLGSLEVVVLLFSNINSAIINVQSILMCNILLLIFAFKGKIINKLFIVCIYVCSGALLELMIFQLLYLLLGVNYNQITPDSIYYLYGNILVNFFLFLVLKISTYYIVSLSKLKIPKKVVMLITLPITTLLFVSNINYFNDIVKGNNIIPIIIIGLFLSNIISFFVFFDIIKIMQENNEIKLKESYKKINELNYQLLESKYRNTQSFLHDVKRHTNIINSLIKNELYAELSDYANEINTEIEKQDTVVSTSQKPLNLILQQYKNEILQHDISLKIDADESDLSFLTLYEQNVTFSNLLENAIESCLKVKNNRNIILKIKTKRNNIIIKVINTCSNAVIKNNKPISSKIDVLNHGFGLNNLEKIVKKYGGKILYVFNDQLKSFEVTIIFDKRGDNYD